MTSSSWQLEISYPFADLNCSSTHPASILSFPTANCTQNVTCQSYFPNTNLPTNAGFYHTCSQDILTPDSEYFQDVTFVEISRFSDINCFSLLKSEFYAVGVCQQSNSDFISESYRYNFQNNTIDHYFYKDACMTTTINSQKTYTFEKCELAGEEYSKVSIWNLFGFQITNFNVNSNIIRKYTPSYSECVEKSINWAIYTECLYNSSKYAVFEDVGVALESQYAVSVFYYDEMCVTPKYYVAAKLNFCSQWADESIFTEMYPDSRIRIPNGTQSFYFSNKNVGSYSVAFFQDSDCNLFIDDQVVAKEGDDCIDFQTYYISDEDASFGSDTHEYTNRMSLYFGCIVGGIVIALFAWMFIHKFWVKPIRKRKKAQLQSDLSRLDSSETENIQVKS